MSMEVPVETLVDETRSHGPTAYAVVSDPDGPPRVTHVSPRFSGDAIVIGVGRRSVELLRGHGSLGLLWPAGDDQPMSIIVDAEVDTVSDDGEVWLRPVSAVRHRPAPSP